MQSSSMFIGNCNIALHVSDAFCVHLQEHQKLQQQPLLLKMDAKSVRNMQSNIAVANKHTAGLHHVGSFYIYIFMLLFSCTAFIRHVITIIHKGSKIIHVVHTHTHTHTHTHADAHTPVREHEDVIVLEDRRGTYRQISYDKQARCNNVKQRRGNITTDIVTVNS